jgi:hypothetical protein
MGKVDKVGKVMIVRKISVQYGNNVNVDYVKYDEDNEYNYFVLLTESDVAKRIIKIKKSCCRFYYSADIVEAEYKKSYKVDTSLK